MPDTIGFWISHAQISADPTLDEWLPDVAPDDGTRVHLTQYGDREVVLYAVDGGGHTWPGGVQYAPTWTVGKTSRDVSATNAILSFFQD